MTEILMVLTGYASLSAFLIAYIIKSQKKLNDTRNKIR
jgi:hypothetical protein